MPTAPFACFTKYSKRPKTLEWEFHFGRPAQRFPVLSHFDTRNKQRHSHGRPHSTFSDQRCTSNSGPLLQQATVPVVASQRATITHRIQVTDFCTYDFRLNNNACRTTQARIARHQRTRLPSHHLSRFVIMSALDGVVSFFLALILRLQSGSNGHSTAHACSCKLCARALRAQSFVTQRYSLSVFEFRVGFLSGVLGVLYVVLIKSLWKTGSGYGAGYEEVNKKAWRNYQSQ
jgi:hypothetical protein